MLICKGFWFTAFLSWLLIWSPFALSCVTFRFTVLVSTIDSIVKERDRQLLHFSYSVLFWGSKAKLWIMKLKFNNNALSEYSASSSVRPLLWFVVLKDVFVAKINNHNSYEASTCVKYVHLSLLSIWECLKLLSLSVNKITSSYMTGGESWLVEYLLSANKVNPWLGTRVVTLQCV